MRNFGIIRLWLLSTIFIPMGQSMASPLEINAFEARAMGTAGAQTASVNDYTAVLYNPGALTRARSVTSGFGITTNVPRLDVKLSKAPTNDSTAPIYPETRTGVTLGASFPLGAQIDNRVAVGIGIYAPMAHTIRGEMLSPQAPQFYRYQNRPDRFVGLGAIAVRVTDWASLGVGFQLFADLIGRVQLDLRLSDRQITSQSARVDFPLKFTPTAGLLLGPFSGVRIGASWRRSTQLRFEIPSTLILDNTISLNFQVGGVVLYTPETYNLGLAYEDETRGWILTVGTTLARWSQAPDPSLSISLDAEGTLLESLGIHERLDLSGSGDVDLAFRDVWSLRLGIEKKVMSVWTVRGGYEYRPGPAPIPTGAYNYLDPSSHKIAAGTGVQLRRSQNPNESQMSLDFGYAGTLLPQQKVVKQVGGQDPVGNYTAGGVVHGFTLSFRHRF